MNDIVERTKKVIAAYLHVEIESVTENMSFMDDLNMDSLAIMELTLAFEDEFSISLEDDSAGSIVCVRDAIRVITKKTATLTE
jgi:acyl carrier protein